MKFSSIAVVLSLLAATSFAEPSANQEKRDASPYYYYKRDADASNMKRDAYYYYKREADAEPYYYYKRQELK
ncbi:5358_t:CDS:2, partial [Acaulospora colombiana]